MSKLAIGKVYLVGAGPGHPKLITVRGLECIQRSDVIVYDRLASPRLLQHAPEDAQRIYVGKLPDRHTMKQEEINQLLVDLALKGHTVCRLKGGDPSIFGRVGEEAELLAASDIEFEIVPGITSAISVPTYAGIPVTHRDMASSISIITGHESPDKLDRSIKWDKVTNATGTLLFLMGVSKIGYIAEQLIKHGRSPETPVALVRWGTRAEQQTVVGTLATIATIVAEAGFKPPAVIVVGEVVRQRETLAWVEKRPLFGRRVVVTRARAQSSELVELIEELGGEPLEFPVIEMVMPREDETFRAQVLEAFERAASYEWIIFTSANGVDYFFRWLAEFGLDIRAFARARLAAVGPRTAAELRLRGLHADVLPPSKFQAEGLLESLQAADLPAGANVLLARGDLARETLPRELAARGANLTEIDVYVNAIAQGQDDFTAELLARGQVDFITFASSSSVANLLEVLQQRRKMTLSQAVDALNEATIACIGPQTAETARQAGLHVSLMPDEATIVSLVESLVKAAASMPRRIVEDEGE